MFRLPELAVPTSRVSRRPEADSKFTMMMDWQDALQEAIHESDPQIMNTKILAAETAIFTRIQDSSSRPDALEEQALFDALGAIRILRSARRISK